MYMFDLLSINSIKDALKEKNETIAVAESVTAGLMQAALSSADEAMKIFQGGITAYNVGQKYRHLLVDPIHALSCNCVSERVAQEMALHVCDMFRSDWGIGVTGYASAVPESTFRLYAYYAIGYRGDTVLSGKIDAQQLDFTGARLFFVNQILEKCRRLFLLEAK